MKPGVSVLVLLFFLLVSAQGIRLEQVSRSAISQKIHEKEMVSMEESVVEDDERVVLHCRDHCAGKNRKLLTKTRPSSKALETNEVGDEREVRRHLRKAVATDAESLGVKSAREKHEQLSTERYPDIVDIAGMDYSPARKKPPIHN